jgi:hypothetical protein
VNELDVGQNRVFPKASRNCVTKYAKQAGYEYQCRTSADGQTFTFYPDCLIQRQCSPVPANPGHRGYNEKMLS